MSILGCGYAGTNINVKYFQHSLALISERGRQIYSWSEKSLILPLVENRTCQPLTATVNITVYLVQECISGFRQISASVLSASFFDHLQNLDVNCTYSESIHDISSLLCTWLNLGPGMHSYFRVNNGK